MAGSSAEEDFQIPRASFLDNDDDDDDDDDDEPDTRHAQDGTMVKN